MPYENNKENMRTTELEDLDDEPTNVRLREDSESTMMFDFSKMRSKNNNSNVSINQVKLDVRRSANFPSGTVRPDSSGSDSSNKITNSAKKGLSNLFGSGKKKVQPFMK
jgi:hypothetical protein